MEVKVDAQRLQLAKQLHSASKCRPHTAWPENVESCLRSAKRWQLLLRGRESFYILWYGPQESVSYWSLPYRPRPVCDGTD